MISCVLQNVNVEGEGASTWFGLIAMACVLTLDELHIRETDHFPEEASGNFRVLRKVDVHGNGACAWFMEFATHCMLTLEELNIYDKDDFQVVDFLQLRPLHFTILRKVHLHGKGAIKWFATFALGCAYTLEDLRIDDSHQFLQAFSVDFRVLRMIGQRLIVGPTPKPTGSLRSTRRLTD
eukprot:GHVU01032044.1.p1 GENE.GHVU01032044.1~~GHVU01032044.1.p1  ORF type:complete len:180 (+),score=5.33 GHVU01032044.1:254-793(+)